MQKQINASVYMVVCNEESNIACALDSAHRFREVVVLDSGSTDRTLAIAGEYSNVRVHSQPWQGYSAQKQAALELCSSEWLVGLDADEELSRELVNDVEALIAAGSHDALECRRRLLHWGRHPRSFQKDDRLVRCFKNSKARYNQRRVHEGLEIEGSIARSNALILHHENLTLAQRFEKNNRYSSLKARDKFEWGHRSNLPLLAVILPFSFLQSFLLKGNFLSGTRGLITSCNDAVYNFLKYAKLWELQQQARKPGAD